MFGLNTDYAVAVPWRGEHPERGGIILARPDGLKRFGNRLICIVPDCDSTFCLRTSRPSSSFRVFAAWSVSSSFRLGDLRPIIVARSFLPVGMSLFFPISRSDWSCGAERSRGLSLDLGRCTGSEPSKCNTICLSAAWHASVSKRPSNWATASRTSRRSVAKS